MTKARLRPVNALPPTDDRPRDDAGTLGDLLYADRAKSRVSENEWTAMLRAIASGDQRALQVLFQRSHRLVFTLTMRIARNRETAEELTLDVFHDIWRRAGTYDPEGGTVLGWILNQARSRAIDRLRFDHRKKRVNAHPEDPALASVESESGDLVELMQSGDRLRDALAVLTPEERQVIEAAFFSELTYAEVAARLAQPLGTVKTRIRSGLGKLRQVLAAEGDRS